MRKIITRREALEMSATLQNEEGKNISGGVKESGYLEKVLACIPVETVSGYLIIQKGLEQAQDKIPYAVSYTLILLMMLINVLYIRHIRSKSVLQYIIVNLAFLIWAYSLGEPFKHLLGENYQPLYATIGMVIVALVLPAAIDRDFFKK